VTFAFMIIAWVAMTNELFGFAFWMLTVALICWVIYWTCHRLEKAFFPKGKRGKNK